MRQSKRRSLLNLASEQPGKEEKLILTLVDNPKITEIQVAKLLYGSNSEANRTALRQLRGRVQDKLLNHLLFLDHSDPRFFVARRYELECLDLLHKLTILALEGEHQLSERLAKRCLRLAQEGEFTSYAEQAAQRLRILYAERGEQSDYLLINKELYRLRQVLEWEREAEQLSLEVRLNMVRTVTKRHDILTKVPAYLERLGALYKQANSFNTFVALYRLQLVYAELIGKYDDIIYYTEQADRLLAEGKLNPRRFDSRFNHFMSVYAHLRGRQPAKGLQLADEYAQEIHPTSSNWFFFYEHFLLLALHAANYDKASLLLHVVQKKPVFCQAAARCPGPVGTARGLRGAGAARRPGGAAAAQPDGLVCGAHRARIHPRQTRA